MKHIIAAIALFALTAPALAQTPQLDRTQEYRMWSAEQMTNRLLNRLSRLTAVCDQTQLRIYAPRLSEACKQAVINAYPRLTTIREIAASGDEVQWAILIDAVHKLETETQPAINDLDRK